MSKSISKVIKKVCEKVDSTKVMIFTNNLKIDGNLYMEDGKCDECHEDIITLTDALVCRISDYCTCDEDDCKCDDYMCFRYDWLNIMVDSVVAYSVLNNK